MKTLGWAYGTEYEIIVGLSKYELSVLEEILEERNLPGEEAVLREWRDVFRAEIDKLNLPNQARNAVIRSLHGQSDLYKRDGKLLSFDEWRNLVNKGYMLSPTFGINNLGRKGYAALIIALQESLSEGESL